MNELIVRKLLNYLGDYYGIDYDVLKHCAELTDEEIEHCKEILKPYEFKVGDKVVFVGNTGAPFRPIKGTIGTVVCYSNDLVQVKWPDSSGVCFNSYLQSYTWWTNSNDVKVYKE